MGQIVYVVFLFDFLVLLSFVVWFIHTVCLVRKLREKGKSRFILDSFL